MRYVFLLLVICKTLGTCAQINQIDHIYAACPNPDKMFHFFREDLGLPVVWDSRVKGKYASSAVWLGNVSLEFVGGDSTHHAQFAGIGYHVCGR
jgi:catechol 2,3-dioxygenase-like lactoylglutathione lyase family enzyme